MQQDDNFDKIEAEAKRKAAYEAIPEISYMQMQAIVNKWLLIADPGIVKLVCADIIANKIDSDPVWLFLIAASGGGKTEIMNALLKVPEYYPLSQLTPNTFLSGYKSKDKEPSLLLQLGSGKTIGFKDFTSLMDGNMDDFKTIMGQFRDIFDGYMTKRTGTGDEIEWRGKLGFIAGCTPMLEQRMKTIGAMGERFLNYNMKQPKLKEVKARMKLNVGKEVQMRNELQDAIAGYLKGVKVPDELPALPPEIEAKLDALSDFIAISRTVVFRSADTKKDLEYIGTPEMPTRTWKQLYTIAVALFIMNDNKWQDVDTYILHRLAISSIHSIRYSLIQRMGKYKGQVKTTTMATEIGYPTSTVRRYLEDLAAISMDDGEIRILNRTYQGVGKPDLWNITEPMKEILRLMGDLQEATKEDTGLQNDETEVPVGVSVDTVSSRPDDSEEYGTKVTALTDDMTDEELHQHGLL